MTTALASYPLSQLQTDLQGLLGDFQGTRFSTYMLNDAINFAIKKMCGIMGYTYTEVSVPQTQVALGIGDQAGTTGSWVTFSLIGKYSTGTAYNYTDYIEIKRVLFGYGPMSPGITPPLSYAFRPMNRSHEPQEDINNPDWRNTNYPKFPQRWDFYDGQRIAVFPLPVAQAGQNGYITVGYVQQPPLLTNLTDTVDPRIPYQVQPFLKYAAASWLLSLDQSDTTSLQTAKMYLDMFNSLLAG